MNHLAHIHVQLFPDDHQQSRRGSLTQFDPTRLHCRRVVGADRKPGIDLIRVKGPVARERADRRPPLLHTQTPRKTESDNQRAAALDERLAGELLLVKKARHGYAPPFAITAAAFWIAVRILGYVPQRHRWPFIAVRIWSSDGFFVVASRSAAWII